MKIRYSVREKVWDCTPIDIGVTRLMIGKTDNRFGALR